MKNEALAQLDFLIGKWKLTMTDAWFLESRDIQIPGAATIEWLGDAFIAMTSQLNREPAWDWVIGRTDAEEKFVVLYHDERGVSRVFDMTLGDGRWTMLREDPDFHQRLVATVEQDRMVVSADASDDRGQTWRKDLELIFERIDPELTGVPGGQPQSGVEIDTKSTLRDLMKPPRSEP